MEGLEVETLASSARDLAVVYGAFPAQVFYMGLNANQGAAAGVGILLETVLAGNASGIRYAKLLAEGIAGKLGSVTCIGDEGMLNNQARNAFEP